MFSPLNEKEKLRISNLSRNPFFSFTRDERTHWSSVWGRGQLDSFCQGNNKHAFYVILQPDFHNLSFLKKIHTLKLAKMFVQRLSLYL